MCLKLKRWRSDRKCHTVMERLHQRLHKLNERQRRHSHLVQVYRGVPETRKSHTDSTHAEHCYKTDRYCQQRARMKGWESYERQPGHKPPKRKTHSCSAPLNLQRKRQISFISQLFLQDNSEIKMRTNVKKCASGILQFEKTHMCHVEFQTKILLSIWRGFLWRKLCPF